jgi:small GTP-binding protein
MKDINNLGLDQGSLYKICLVGDGGVGKTTIVERYLGNSFRAGYQLTIGAEIKVYSQNIDGKVIKFQIWDLAGQSRFKFVRSSFYRGSHAVIMVFDLTNLETLYNLFAWKSEILSNIGYEVPLIILGNKNDLKDQIEKEIVKEVIKEIRYEFILDEVPYFTTSAYSGQNIIESFTSLGRILNRTPPIALQQTIIAI